MDNNILYKFFENKASEEEEATLFAWLDESSANHKIMLKERRIYDSLLFATGPVDDGRGVVKKLSLVPTWVKEVSRYAAVLLCFVGGSWIYGDYEDRISSSLMHTVSVPAGQRVNVTLSDGTKVILNSMSELKYPSNFSDDSRVVELDGEAYFDVTKSQSAPFIVKTQFCGVEVLGTVFNVDAYSDNNEFRTSLIEGSVVVRHNVDHKKHITLTPSQEVSFHNNEFIITALKDKNQFLWREGVLSFSERLFPSLICDLEHHFGVEINILSDEILQKTISGKIRLSEGADHCLRVLQKFEEFNYSWSEDRKVINIY